MVMGTAEVLPVAARAVRVAGTPGRVRGEKLTAPLMSEVAVAVCVASSVPGVQMVCVEQGGVNALRD